MSASTTWSDAAERARCGLPWRRTSLDGQRVGDVAGQRQLLDPLPAAGCAAAVPPTRLVVAPARCDHDPRRLVARPQSCGILARHDLARESARSRRSGLSYGLGRPRERLVAAAQRRRSSDRRSAWPARPALAVGGRRRAGQPSADRLPRAGSSWNGVPVTTSRPKTDSSTSNGVATHDGEQVGQHGGRDEADRAARTLHGCRAVDGARHAGGDVDRGPARPRASAVQPTSWPAPGAVAVGVTQGAPGQQEQQDRDDRGGSADRPGDEGPDRSRHGAVDVPPHRSGDHDCRCRPAPARRRRVGGRDRVHVRSIRSAAPATDQVGDAHPQAARNSRPMPRAAACRRNRAGRGAGRRCAGGASPTVGRLATGPVAPSIESTLTCANASRWSYGSP